MKVQLLSLVILITLISHVTSSNQQTQQRPLETRITKLNNFLVNNPRTEEEAQQYHLHPAYYAAEVANILYGANLHSSVLDINAFVDSLCTFASSLQSKESQRDMSVYGSFQSYPHERSEREEYNPSVADFFHGLKICGVSNAITGSTGDLDAAASISFLKNSVGGGVYRLHPRAETASVVSLYYGTKAYNLLYDLFASYRWQISSITQDPKKIEEALKELVQDFESANNPLYEIHLFLGTLENLGQLGTYLKYVEPEFKNRLLRAILERQDPVTGAFAQQPGRSPDLLSTFYAIASLNKIHPQQLNDAAQGNFLAWILQCQGPSGGFAPSPSAIGHPKWITTHAAASILHILGRLRYLEAYYPEDKSGSIGFSIQSVRRAIENLDWETATSAQVVMPTLGFGALIIAMISLYSQHQPLRQVRHKQEEEEEPQIQEISQEGRNVLPASPKQKTFSVIRNNDTLECLDKDGNSFAMTPKNMKNWEIVTERNTLDGARTTFVLRYKGKK